MNLCIDTTTSAEIDLDGQTAVVTGAGGGIGGAICATLAREGADIVAVDIDSEGFDDVEAKVNAEEQRCISARCDVSDPDEVGELGEQVSNETDSVEILVCAHGVVTRKSLAEISVEDWHRDIKVNLTGTFLLIKEFYESMRDNQYGKIVCIGSIAGENGGYKTSSNYAASKGGVHALVKYVAQQAATFNIYANGIAPGIIRTPMNEDEVLPEDISPLDRLGAVEDIAEATLFLSSQQSHYVTGKILEVTGGTEVNGERMWNTFVKQ